VSRALVVLAAGVGTRYGGLKQLVPVGPAGEAILDYTLHDAARAGFDRAVLVIRADIEPAFSEHFARWRPPIEVVYARQDIDGDATGRTKPWGTAHAVITARPLVDGPFAVCNADDFYGRAAFEALYGSLADPEDVELSLVGYRLGDTLSEAGGVSRAVCTVDDDGYLTHLIEIRNVRRVDDAIVGRTLGGQTVSLTEDEIVSMNCWGLHPGVLALLDDQFAEFRAADRGPDAELLLSTTINEVVVSGGGRLRVRAAGAGWFGVTWPSDKARAEVEIRRLVDQGMYPSTLCTAG